jgi:endonuclease/exonuclease/phosphatase family metal-dependent hydrolase
MIRFATINIEGHRHLERLIPFLQAQKIQIACLQEVFEDDITTLKEALKGELVYAPMGVMTQFLPDGKSFTGKWGVAILSTFPLKSHDSATYVGSDQNLPEFIQGEPNSLNRVFLHACIDVKGLELKVSTTHFTWTPDGNPTPEQWENYASLKPVLAEHQPDIFCGDLNSARGTNGVFDDLAKTWQDNIPAEATTSIDGELHKAGHLQLMVDALFTGPKVLVQNTKLHTGVSDHQAVTANLALT